MLRISSESVCRAVDFHSHTKSPLTRQHTYVMFSSRTSESVRIKTVTVGPRSNGYFLAVFSLPFNIKEFGEHVDSIYVHKYFISSCKSGESSEQLQNLYSCGIFFRITFCKILCMSYFLEKTCNNDYVLVGRKLILSI